MVARCAGDGRMGSGGRVETWAGVLAGDLTLTLFGFPAAHPC